MEKHSLPGSRPAGKEPITRDSHAVQEANCSEVVFLLGRKGQARAEEDLGCHANAGLLCVRGKLVTCSWGTSPPLT